MWHSPCPAFWPDCPAAWDGAPFGSTYLLTSDSEMVEPFTRAATPTSLLQPASMVAARAAAARAETMRRRLTASRMSCAATRPHAGTGAPFTASSTWAHHASKATSRNGSPPNFTSANEPSGLTTPLGRGTDIVATAGL